MNSRRDRLRTNLEGDKISSLPGDLLAKILSFIGLKQAVETSVLSSRWRLIWTKIPYLNFSSKDFSTLQRFLNFFKHVTSSCDNQVEMSVNFYGKNNKLLVQRILNHACSCNLQQLTFTFLHEKLIKSPFSLFSSRSLKHLTLIGYDGSDGVSTSMWEMWELPALTTLHLESVTLRDGSMDKCVGLMSNFKNLKNLTMRNFGIKGSNSFTICHPQVSNLTLKHSCSQNVVNVIAPQLKILIIEDWSGEVRVSAPDHLTSMLYRNNNFLLSLDIDCLPYLEKVGLCISNESLLSDALRVVNLFQKFSHVKFLTLSFELIEVISSAVEAISHQPSSFVNLRSLVIRPELYDSRHEESTLTMSTEVKNYLLDSSLGATFKMVTREEIRAMRDSKLAREQMEELWMLLHLENVRVELNEEDKCPQQYWWMKMPLDNEKRIARVDNDWKGLKKEIKRWEKRISDIISLIRRIERLLNKLPTSNKAELQTRLSTLSEEADIVVSKILNRMKNNLDAKQSSLSVSCHQLFAAAQSSS